MGTASFNPGDQIIHEYWGNGTITSVWAVAQNPDEETEYTVRIPGYRHPFTLGETRMILAAPPTQIACPCGDTSVHA